MIKKTQRQAVKPGPGVTARAGVAPPSGFLSGHPAPAVLWSAGALFAFVLLFYGLGLFPDVGPIDSGELILAAWAPGVAHAPGFPAYVFSGWVWTHLLPWGNVAWRLNLFSAICSALGVAVAFLFAERLITLLGTSDRLSSLLWAACGATALAAGGVYHRWALTAEVYSFHNLLLAAGLWCVISVTNKKARFLLAGCLLGTSLAVHWVSAGFLLPLLAAILWTPGIDVSGPSGQKRDAGRVFLHRKVRPIDQKDIALLLTGIAIPFFLFYGAMLLLARSEPVLNWGNPADLKRLWWHFTARQYQTNLMTVTGPDLISSLWNNLFLWIREFHFLGFPIALWGWALIGRRHRLWFWGWLSGAAVNFVFAVVQSAAYTDPTQDRDSYLLPLLFSTSLGLAPGLADLASRWVKSGFYHRRILAGLILIGFLGLFLWQHTSRDRSSDTSCSDYVRNALEPLPSGSLVLTADWQLVSPALYMMDTNGFRRDIILIDLAMWQNRPWYIDQFSRRYPELCAAWQPVLSDFLGELRRFEEDRLENASRIATLYRRLLISMLEVQSRPVYLHSTAFQQMHQFRAAEYGSFVPEGILFRFYRENPPRQIPALNWRTEALLDARHFSDPLMAYIRRQHSSMVEQRLRFLSLHGPDDQREKETRLLQLLQTGNH